LNNIPTPITLSKVQPLARFSTPLRGTLHTRAIHWGKGKKHRLRDKAKLLLKNVKDTTEYTMAQDTTRSRRQRLKDLVKTTRDVYIPSLSNTITHLANEATTRALGYAEPEEPSVNRNIQGAQIVLYPHFTRVDGNSFYYTQAHGWVFSTEGSTRKKKIILALAKQLAKSNNPAISDITAGQLDEQLSSLNDPSDSGSIVSSSSEFAYQRSLRRVNTPSSACSETSAMSNGSETDDVLKERIAAFVNKSLGNAELVISVGDENRDEMTVVELLTDSNGNFNTDVVTPYRPSFIQVSLAVDEKIFAFRETIFPGTSKYAVISDIDDTIKKTGVCGDKRSLFRNTFADHMETWEIPGAADCYRFLRGKFDVSFFYVSNSPYQLYSNLTKFFEMFEFPSGSMYLKKYTGNFLNSFMEPSHARKKAALERIMQHFQDKKFFLIGDTSEQDLEAYVDIARQHPDKVKAIYLRVAENSMSTESFKALNDIIHKRSVPLQYPPNDIKANFIGLQSSDQNLIDLNDEPAPGISKEEMASLLKESEKKASKMNQDLESGSNDEFFASGSELPTDSPVPSPPPTPMRPNPPAVPRKPAFLRSDHVSESVESLSSSKSMRLPPLPRRPVPTPPPRSNVNSAPPPSFNANLNYSSDETVDWIGRSLTSILVLEKVGDIKLKFFTEFADIQDEMNTIVKNEL
jgi:phosphatidate phosphatase APP1